MIFQARPSRSKTIERVLTFSHLCGTSLSSSSHVMELGCGDGHFLIHQAFIHPEMTFFGIDLDSDAVKSAQGHISDLQLKNIEIVCGDIASMGEAKVADIIYVHGLLSWIDEPTQAAMLKIISRSSHPGSCVVASCNVLPGFHMRSIVHQYFERFGDIQDTMTCLDALRTLKKVAPYEFEKPYGLLLHQEISKLESGSAQYIKEEFLKVPRAFFLGDIVRLFGNYGFSFAGDARFQRNYSWRGLGHHYQEVAKAEEFFDFAFGTTFRELVFFSGPSQGLHREQIKSLIFTSSLETISLAEDFDISPLQELLRNVWPGGRSYSELIADGFFDDEIWNHLVVEKIDAVKERYSVKPSLNPYVPSCFQTLRDGEWANRRYEPVHVSAFDDAVLRQCDGTRDVDKISEVLLALMGSEAPGYEEMKSAVNESITTLRKALLL